MDLASISRIFEFVDGLINRIRSALNKKSSSTVVINGDVYIIIDKDGKN